MTVLNHPQVTAASATGYWVQISHGKYLAERDDRVSPPVWKAYGPDGVHVGARPDSTDPLRSVVTVCTAWPTAEDMVQALLTCDGRTVTA